MTDNNLDLLDVISTRRYVKNMYETAEDTGKTIDLTNTEFISGAAAQEIVIQQQEHPDVETIPPTDGPNKMVLDWAEEIIHRIKNV